MAQTRKRLKIITPLIFATALTVFMLIPKGITKSLLGQPGLPRGMSNNNPGNIRITSIQWKGEIPLLQNNDGAFEQFFEYRYGVRAMIVILQSYQKQGLKTLSDVIFRWAPLFENPTLTYIDTVSMQTGINPYVELNFDKSELEKIVVSMAEFENGRPAVTSSDFRNAWAIL